MKKKFSLLILSLLSLLFININAYANSACENFYEDLKKNYTKYEVGNRPTYKYSDYGFELQTKYNASKKLWELDTSPEGYFKVGRLTDESLIGKISENDLIISANQIDLRKKGLSRDGTQLEDLFNDDEEINFIFKNDKTFDLKLQRLIRDLGTPFTDVYVRSIEISEKTNKIDAGLVLSFQYLTEKAENDPVYKSAIQNLQYEEDSQKKIESCAFKENDWQALRALDPAEGLEFANIHSINQSLLRTNYFVTAYSEEIPSDVELGWGNDLTVDYYADGIFTFKTNFDLRNFPFDKQKINFYLVNRNRAMKNQLTLVSDFTKNELVNFANKNNINGWDIVGNNLSYKPYKGPNDTLYYDGLSVELEIERKHSYYLYKVIIPILLILMVCWSSLWVTPKELESRLTITIVCLLSLIAYNFVIDKEIPKLEYLTILDWIILISYVYAAIPNFFSIYSHRLFSTNKRKCIRVENLGRKYGPTSYLLIVFLIISISVNTNPQNASAIISWMSGVN